MKNLTKNSVANVAKVGVASALIGAGLFLSACGGDSTSKAEKLAKQAIEKDFAGAKILNFDEAKKRAWIDKQRMFGKNSRSVFLCVECRKNGRWIANT